MPSSSLYMWNTLALLFMCSALTFALWVWHRSLKLILSLLESIMTAIRILSATPNWPSLPTNCFSCGVVLQGGATQHKAGCTVQALINEHFPKVN